MSKVKIYVAGKHYVIEENDLLENEPGFIHFFSKSGGLEEEHKFWDFPYSVSKQTPWNKK